MKRAARLTAWLLLLTSHAALAEEPSYPSIHLNVSPPQSAVVPLLRAELDALGLTVAEGPTETPSITIHAVLGADSLEVRLTDDATGDTLLREVFSIESGRTMDARTAVLHTTELLRWHLHYPMPTVAPAPPPAPPPPPPPAAPPERDASFRVGLLPFATYSPGGTELGMGAQLDVSRRWSWFGVRVVGASSFVPNRMGVAEGQVQAGATWAGVEGAATWEPGPHGLALELGLGAAFFTSALRGRASGDNAGRDDRLVTAAPLVDLRASQRLSKNLGLVLGAQYLLPLESSRLRVLDRNVGSYGRHVLALGLGLELSVF